LRDADLQRAEAGLRADLRGENLVDRRPGGAAARRRRARHDSAERSHTRVAAAAAARIRLARHDSAERAEVPVALAVHPRSDVVDAAEHVHVIANAAERRETCRQLEVLAGFARNPVALR